MKSFSYLKAIPLSTCSKALYRDVAKNWDGVGIAYLLLVLSLYLMPGIYQHFAYFSKMIDTPEHSRSEVSPPSTYNHTDIIAALIRQFPEISIRGGKASSLVAQPFHINNPKTGKPLIIIDTTGQTKSLSGSPAIIMINEDGVITKENKEDSSKIKFSDMQDVEITHELLYKLSKWWAIMVFPGTILSLFIYYGVAAIVLASAGFALGSVLKINLDFKTLTRLAVVAASPGLIIESLSSILNIRLFSNPGLIYFLLHATYLFYAMDANKKGRRA